MNNKSYNIGSYYFFNKFKDYKIHDRDKTVICDNFPVPVLNMKKDGSDIFFIKRLDKEDLFKYHLNKENPLRAGKFLIPEIAKEFNITINDLIQMRNIFDYLDNTHEYEKIILESYIKNNGFYLTNEQSEKAYIIYKIYRFDNYYKEKFKVGSWTFFENFNDYKIHDYDYVIFDESITKCLSKYMKETNEDFHFIPLKNKNELIELFKNEKYPEIKACSFLFPEIIQKLNIEINDIIKIKDILEKLKFSKPYLYYIYQSYIENNQLSLTDKQLNNAYEIYKQSKNK